MEKTPIAWSPVSGFEHLYEISSTGIIRSLHPNRKGQVLAARIDRGGYLTVRLTYKGKSFTRLLHRLLAEAYIPKVAGKHFINHINGNKLDNSLDNLEWVTHKENMKHAYAIGLILKKTKMVIDGCNGKLYPNAKQAAIENGINYFTCKSYLNGKRSNPTCLKYAA